MATCAACGEESPDGFKFCPHCAAPLSTSAPSTGLERKTISVLFCDLAGFTSASESADPEEVQARLSRYHSRLRSEIELLIAEPSMKRPND